MRELKGKGAFVTGAASGIGLGIAEVLAARGVDLVLADIEADALEAARTRIAPSGVRVETILLDVSDREAMRAAAGQARAAIGRVHILCNNAGVEYSGVPLDRVPDGDWDWAVGVNIMGVINGLQAFLPLLKEHGEGGHVVNTASIGGLQVTPGFEYGVYTTTKFAVVGLSEALREDLAPHGIGVSVLCPAAVRTGILDSGRNRPDRFGGPFRVPESHPLHEALKTGMAPREIGEWVVAAMRDDAFYILPHAATRDRVRARHQRIEDAYDWADRVRGEIGAGGKTR